MRSLHHVLLCACLAVAGMYAGPAAAALSIGVSAQASNSFTETITTSAVTTQSSGSTFVVFIVGTLPTGSTVNDDMGNIYVLKYTASFNSSSASGYIYECENGTGGTGHTWTVTTTSYSSLTVFAVEIKGSGGYATLDVSPTGTNNIANATSAATPSITTSASGDVVLSGLFGFSGSTITVNDSTGFNNIIESYLTGASNNVVGAVGGTVQASSGAVSDTFTISPATNVATVIAAWKLSGGSACTHEGYSSSGALATPNGTSGSYLGTTDSFVTPNCSSVEYWQLTIGNFGVN